MSSGKNINILIADDHQVVVEGLELLLGRIPEFNVVGKVNNGLEVIEILQSTQVDITLLDIEMPRLDGLETCKHIKTQYPDIKVLMLSSYHKGALITQALKNGADGFVIKNKLSEELVKAINTIMSDESYLDSEANHALISSLHHHKQSGDYLPKISRREKEVLQLIIDEYSTAEIAKTLHLSINTIESHRRNLLGKLGAKNMAGLVRIALEKGLLND